MGINYPYSALVDTSISNVSYNIGGMNIGMIRILETNTNTRFPHKLVFTNPVPQVLG